MLTDGYTVMKEAKERLGEAEFDRRMKIADDKAQQCQDDPTIFPEQKGEDRWSIQGFMAHRFRQLAAQLGEENWAKFERMSHDSCWVVVVKLIEKGHMI